MIEQAQDKTSAGEWLHKMKEFALQAKGHRVSWDSSSYHIIIILTWDDTIWAMHLTTMSCIIGDGLCFIMCSNGRKKSFWKLKPGSSPFSRNFIDNWRKLSTAKNETPSSSLQPTALKCSPANKAIHVGAKQIGKKGGGNLKHLG